MTAVTERTPDPLPPARHDRMQRVRVGVTGLAAVMLIVAVATAIASNVQHRADAAGPGNGSTVQAASSAVDPGSDPLAQTGRGPAVDRERQGQAVGSRSQSCQGGWRSSDV